MESNVELSGLKLKKDEDNVINTEDGHFAKVKVEQQSHYQVELKMHCGAEDLFNHVFKLETILTVPKSLGVLSKHSFADQVWLLNRMGRDKSLDLEQILERTPPFKRNLIQELRQAIRTIGSGMSESYPVLMEQHLSKLEEGLRHFGCELKSAIRSGRKNTRPEIFLPQLQAVVKEAASIAADIELETSDEVANALASKMEEFVLMTTEQCCARLALELGQLRGSEDGACIMACDIGRKAHEDIKTIRRLRPQKLSELNSNEEYLFRWRSLKHYFQSVLYLESKVRQPSVLWMDFVGMAMAGVAMMVAVLLMWLAERQMGRFTVQLLVVLTLSYILKDRIKEWGKRYIIPLIHYPFRMTNIVYSQGSSGKGIVGRTNEWFEVLEKNRSSQVEYNLRKLRRADRGNTGSTLKVADPFMQPLDRLNTVAENSFAYNRELWLEEDAWRKATTQVHKRGGLGRSSLQDQDSFVQVVRINLAEFCRRVGRSDETYALFSSSGVPKTISCPQAYQLRLKVRVSRVRRKSRWVGLREKLRKLCFATGSDTSPSETMEEHKFFVMIDADGIRHIDRREV